MKALAVHTPVALSFFSVLTTAETAPLATVTGPFTSDQDSLLQYECLDWFRDGKFGIWSHWGPQAVPMFGDWYARHLYTEDHRRENYQHHLEHHAHPSEEGWKDTIPLWKAGKLDPEPLMKLYKDAGANYFVSMADHHDNFDLWDSTHHKWNAVKTGPELATGGDWQKAAKNQVNHSMMNHDSAQAANRRSLRRNSFFCTISHPQTISNEAS